MAGKKAIAKPNQAVARRGSNSHDITLSGQTVTIGTLLKGLKGKGCNISPQVLEALSSWPESFVVGGNVIAFRRLNSLLSTSTSKSTEEISAAIRAYKLNRCHIPTVLAALLDHMETFIRILEVENIITFFSTPVVWADFQCVLCLVNNGGVPTVMFTFGHPNVRLYRSTMLVFEQGI